MSASNQPSRPFGSVRARKARSARLGTLARAIVETLEQRQLLSVTSATITAATSQVNEGNSVALTLSGSTDNGDGTIWYVNPGDGSGPGYPIYVAAGQTAEYDYTFPGDEGAAYQVTAKVYDDQSCCGGGGSNSPYDATPANLTIADASISFDTSGGDATATEGDSGTTIVLGTINDLGSDPSPDPTYVGQIDWGDGSSSAAFIDGTTVEGTHAYAEEGSYTASVDVQDDGNSTASGQVTVNVADAPITVSVQGPPNPIEGQAFTNAVVGTVTDQNLNAPGGDFSGTIDWGDGHTTDATFSAVPGQPGTFNILGSHTYAEEQGYDMVIAATDVGGSSDTSSNMFDVADAPISLSAADQVNATEGITTPMVTVATLTDTNPNASAADFTNNVMINWGNGNSSPAALAPGAQPGTFLVQGSNLYAEEGQYTITVTANDVGGSVADPVNNYADVQDAPISLTPTPVGVFEQLPTGDMNIATLVDTNTQNIDATDFNGTVNYGDNTGGNLSFNALGGGLFSVIAPTHTYTDEGVYAATYTVTDIGQAPPASNYTSIAVAEGAMSVSLASNFIASSSDGTQNLVPMTITTHNEPTASWALALQQGDSAKVDVWDTANPGPNDTPLLGLVNGTIVTTTAWAPGVPVPTTLYVGAYHGSSVIGDVLFALTESEPTAPSTSVTSSPATVASADLNIDADNNDGLGLPDQSATEEAINEDPTQPGKEVLIDDGTLTPASYTPVTLDLSGVDSTDGTVAFNYGSAFQLFAPDGTLVNPNQGYSPSQFGFTSTASQEVVFKLDAVAQASSTGDGTISVSVNAASSENPLYLADAVQADPVSFQIEQVGFGATDPAAFHAVRLDPTATNFTPRILDTIQWEDLNHNGRGGDTGERNGPICYTRSGANGNVIMTVHANLYVNGPVLKGSYMVKAQLVVPDGGGFFYTNAVVATAGTLTNGLTLQTDNVLTADLTAADFILPSTIAKEDYRLNFLVSADGGTTWAKGGNSSTICYVINGALPTAWTYNNEPDDTTHQNDPDTHPLWSVLDISCRACDGKNLAAAAGGNYSPIINAIWQEFVDNQSAGVLDAHGDHMHYWATTTTNTKTNAQYTTGLIANQDGTCGGWAGLLVDCLRAQGVTGATVYGINPTPGSQTPPDAQHPTLQGFRITNASAQGGTPAKIDFTNHAVVELSPHGPVYDPSYGLYFGSELEWMDAAAPTFVFDTLIGGDGKLGSGHVNGVADCTFTAQPI
jgi:hypothetical protein